MRMPIAGSFLRGRGKMVLFRYQFCLSSIQFCLSSISRGPSSGTRFLLQKRIEDKQTGVDYKFQQMFDRGCCGAIRGGAWRGCLWVPKQKTKVDGVTRVLCAWDGPERESDVLWLCLHAARVQNKIDHERTPFYPEAPGVSSIVSVSLLPQNIEQSEPFIMCFLHGNTNNIHRGYPLRAKSRVFSSSSSG